MTHPDITPDDDHYLDQAGSWLIRQLKPGQLIQLNVLKMSTSRHLFLFEPRTFETGAEMVYRPDVYVEGGVWVMFLSDIVEEDVSETWMAVVHNGHVMSTCVLNFLQWFDSKQIIPEQWKEVL